MKNLSGMNVAILVENGFEQVELIEPRKALDQAGAETRIGRRSLNRFAGGSSLIGATSFLWTFLSKEQTLRATTRCCYQGVS
jgi:hypothetical protein